MNRSEIMKRFVDQLKENLYQHSPEEVIRITKVKKDDHQSDSDVKQMVVEARTRIAEALDKLKEKA